MLNNVVAGFVKKGLYLTLYSTSRRSTISNPNLNFNPFGRIIIMTTTTTSGREYSTTKSFPKNVSITSDTKEFEHVLNAECIDFLSKLHTNFEATRQALLKNRIERQKELDAGQTPTFLASTKEIREKDWSIAPIPGPLQRRRVEITGPVDKRMVINALNSGADCYMADFEDSNTPTWKNQLGGQSNLKAAIERSIDFKAEGTGKEYKLNDKIATLLVRPRGWHLNEKNVSVNGQKMSGSLFDFGIYFFHNAKTLVSQGAGPYFYLPKLESHLEARLWNDVFLFSQKELGLPSGTIKATVLIETILAAFEMDEILYELREHSAGLNAGRWDYIFSCIKKFRARKDLCFADRKQITMTSPFMRAYALLLIQTCHRRKASAMGGMSALIPIKNDSAANDKALGGVREDKARDASDGYDGGWVAHPGLVSLAMEEFEKVLAGRPNQIDKIITVPESTGEDLLKFGPSEPITEAGLKLNITVGLQYSAAWLTGTGCVPIFNLMEDAATAEICRSQVWQWIHSSRGSLEDGTKITAELFKSLLAEELSRLKALNPSLPYDKAAQLFSQVATNSNFEEFLTLPLYENVV